MMQVDEQFLHMRVIVDDFFGQQKQSAVCHAVGNSTHQHVSSLKIEELQGVVHDDHRRIADLNIPDIGEPEVNRLIAAHDGPAALDHGLRIVDGNNSHIRRANALAHCERCGAK